MLRLPARPAGPARAAAQQCCTAALPRVRATTPMKVVVMTADQMQWILEHDYGADGEMTKTIKKRAEELRRKSLDNGIVHA